MTHCVDETIVAIASAPGNALRGIIRISGPDTSRVMQSAFEFDDRISAALESAKNAIRVDVTVELEDGLDVEFQLLYWPDTRSYTRQPAAEIHCLGAPGLLEMLLERLITCGGRRAEPGEFTMRAFLAGRLDLAQAEAVMGVIDAKNRRQFDTAFAQLAGGIGGPVTQARELLIGLLAELEAGLDFVEEDIEFISQQQLVTQLEHAGSTIQSIIDQISSRRQESLTISVVLMGRPNVGKSSLFNKLTAGSAIVSDQSGTTRDYLTAQIEIDTQTIELVDTAGLQDNESVNPIDRMMAGQTDKAVEQADLRILCLESGVEPDDWERSLLDQTSESLIVVFTKCDLDYDPTLEPGAGIQTSAVRAMGIEELKQEIGRRMQQLVTDANHASATVGRTSESLNQAAHSIRLAHDAAVNGVGEELIAAEVRTGLDHLGRVVGKIYTDDILDQVFGRFCIGK